MKVFFITIVIILTAATFGQLPAFGQSIERCGTIHIIESVRSGNLTDLQFVLPDDGELNSFQSDSGRFIFWYTLEGANAIPAVDTNSSGIPDWVETAAAAADSAWTYFIDFLEYNPPLESNETYSFYFQNLGFYGFTGFIDGELVSTIDSTFEWIEPNDASDPQIGALEITIAHELYHVIQYGYNEWQGPSGQTDWLEMDAVNAENLVFPHVGEYKNLLNEQSIFRNPSRSTPVAYNHVTWMIYFTERFGDDFFKRMWDKIDENTELSMPEAIQILLGDEVSFKEELIRLHAWHLASGSWSREGYGFESAEAYPTSFKRSQRSTVPTSPYPVWFIDRFAANYHAIIPSENDTGEALITFYTEDEKTGLAVLIYLQDGEIIEQIYLPDDEKITKINTGFLWENVQQFGLAVANLDVTSTHIHQLLVGAGVGIEQIQYGDANRSGQLNTEDVQFILDDYVNPNLNQVILANRTAATVTGDPNFSALDAALIYRRISGFEQGFPVDKNGSGFGPEFESYFDNDTFKNQHVSLLQNQPVLRFEKIETDDDDDIRVRVFLDGFEESISSVSLTFDWNAPILNAESISATGSIFDDIKQAVHVNELNSKAAWVSNQPRTGQALGTIIFSAEDEGVVTVMPSSIKIDNQLVDVIVEGTTFTVENNPAVSVRNPEVPNDFSLFQNYPNPFNPSTTISFRLDETATVRLEVYSVSGQLIQVIADGIFSKGTHSDIFKAGDLSSGVYLYRITVNGDTSSFSQTKKMLLVK